MYLRLAYENTGRVGPRKTLALAMALVLSFGAFVLAGREAQGQQHPQAKQLHTAVVNDRAVAEPVTRSPVETSPVKTPSAKVKMPPVKARTFDPEPPVGSTAPVPKKTPQPGNWPGFPVRHDPKLSVGSDSALPGGSSGLKPAPAPSENSAPDPKPTFVPEPTTKPNLMSQVEPAPLLSSPAPKSVTVKADKPLSSSSRAGENAPKSGPPPAPKPVAFEESKLLSSSRVGEEAPTPRPVVPDTRKEGGPLPLPSSLETAASSAVKTPVKASQSANASVPGNLTGGFPSRAMAKDQGSVITLPASLSFFEGEAGRTDITERAEDPESSPGGGKEEPSIGALQSSSPFALSLGSLFSSSSAGGKVGAGGGVPLLSCVLVAVLFLLRRDSMLSWTSWELPKPSSALLLPLERPG